MDQSQATRRLDACLVPGARLLVSSVSTCERYQPRPVPLNTVSLLQAFVKSLGEVY
jgi:hypothetical protein